MAALVFGLVTFTAAFIAEIVRAGVLAVPFGQSEAAGALGLHRGLSMRLVVIPQAMRLITPPLTSQYLNIVKNSSLAVLLVIRISCRFSLARFSTRHRRRCR